MVAARLPEVSLGLMKDDPAPEVRRIIAKRIADDEAVDFLQDEDWLVRYTAAQHVPTEALASVLTDDEPDVRTLAEHRLSIKHPEARSDD